MGRVPELPARDLDDALMHGERVWPALRGARLFITGARGFVGSWLLETLLRANRAHGLGIRATALVRDPAAFSERLPHLASAPEVAVIAGDARRPIAVAGAFTHFVHCASAATPDENTRHPDGVVDLIETGTRNVLDVARRHGGARFLQMSSGAVYGPQPQGMSRLPESYPGEANAAVPDERFGAAKLAAERFGVGAADDEVHFVAARAFGLVGPRLPLDGQFAIGNFLSDAAAGRAVAVSGDGTPIRSWLYAADLAAWCWTILAHGKAGAAYNVGSDEAISIGEAARRVAAIVEPPLPVTTAKTADPDAPTSRFVPDITRARSELGLEVRIGLNDALRRTWEWARQ